MKYDYELKFWVSVPKAKIDSAISVENVSLHILIQTLVNFFTAEAANIFQGSIHLFC